MREQGGFCENFVNEQASLSKQVGFFKEIPGTSRVRVVNWANLLFKYEIDLLRLGK